VQVPFDGRDADVQQPRDATVGVAAGRGLAAPRSTLGPGVLEDRAALPEPVGGLVPPTDCGCAAWERHGITEGPLISSPVITLPAGQRRGPRSL